MTECRCDCVNCVTGHCDGCYYGTPHKTCDCHLHATQTCDICSGPSGPDVVEERPVRSTLTVQEVATLTARCEALQDQLGTAEGTIELLKRRALQAEQRSEVLEAALEDVNAFLKHIEWNDTTSEHDAENLRHQIDVALSTLDPTP